MSRPSTIETHRCRLEIEEALRRGVPVRQVARRYALSHPAVGRHRKKMEEMGALRPQLPIPAALEGEIVGRDLEYHDDPIQFLTGLQKAMLHDFSAARHRGDDPAAVHWARELRALVEVKAKLAPTTPVEDPRSAEIRRRIEKQAKVRDALVQLFQRVQQRQVDHEDEAAAAQLALPS